MASLLLCAETMMRYPIVIRSAVLMAAVVNLLVFMLSGARPWYLGWGATELERSRSLPGDELVLHPQPGAGSTRAITIRAPAAAVWPWLAQLGQDRAGFYSYELLEDLVGCEMPHENRIQPQFQGWRVGDKLWMYPPHKLDGAGHARLARYEHGRVLAFATRQVGTAPEQPYDGMWNFVLEPVDSHTSRLIVRGRAEGARSFLANAFDRLVFEPVHFVMERRMMEEIKRLAEGTPSSRASLAVQPISWMLLALLAAVCAVRVLRGQSFAQSLALFLACGAVLQVLMFAQPAAWLGVAASALLWLLALVGHGGWLGVYFSRRWTARSKLQSSSR
jgi:hypothetical protein